MRRGATRAGRPGRRRLLAVALVGTAGALVPGAAARADATGAPTATLPASRAPDGAHHRTPPVRAHVVGGRLVTAADAPWQVRIRIRQDRRPFDAPESFAYATCGGAIIDPTHVVTAAHCVLDGRRQVPPEVLRVDAGSSRFDPREGAGGGPDPLPSDTPQARAVASVRHHPGYVLRDVPAGAVGELADDVAVLTLAAPLVVDANARPIPLTEAGPSPTGPARVTGFGAQLDGGPADGHLYALDVPLVDAAAPVSRGGAGGANALYAVSRTLDGSTCQGDSGGPLVQGGRLVGVVSSGPACGGGLPSYHTNLAAPEIRAFVLGSDAPPAAPRGGEEVALRAPARPRTGDPFVCVSGAWTNRPSIAHVFLDARDGRVLQTGPRSTYVPGPGAVGARVACRSVATTAGGTGRTQVSAPSRTVRRGPAPRLAVSARAPSAARPGARVELRVVVRNAGVGTATGVRTCLRPGRGVVVPATSGGTRNGDRVCFASPTLRRARTRRVELDVRPGAATGRTTLVTVDVAAAGARPVRVVRRVLVRR